MTSSSAHAPPALDRVEQHRRRGGRRPGGVPAHRRQRGRHQARDRVVVEPGHGHVVRDAQAEFGAGHVRAVGEGVGEREDRGWPAGPAQGRERGRAPVRGREPAHAGVDAPPPPRPVHPRCEHRDPLVAEVAEVVEHEIRARVGGKADRPGGRRAGPARRRRPAPRRRSPASRPSPAPPAARSGRRRAGRSGRAPARARSPRRRRRRRAACSGRAGAGAAGAPTRTPGASSRPGCRRSRRSRPRSRCAGRARSGRSGSRSGRRRRGRARPSPADTRWPRRAYDTPAGERPVSSATSRSVALLRLGRLSGTIMVNRFTRPGSAQTRASTCTSICGRTPSSRRSPRVTRRRASTAAARQLRLELGLRARRAAVRRRPRPRPPDRAARRRRDRRRRDLDLDTDRGRVAAGGRGPPAARRLPRGHRRGRRGLGRAPAGVRRRLPGRATTPAPPIARRLAGLRRPLAAERGARHAGRARPLRAAAPDARAGGPPALRPPGPAPWTRAEPADPRLPAWWTSLAQYPAWSLRAFATWRALGAAAYPTLRVVFAIMAGGRALPRGPLAHVQRPCRRHRPEPLPRLSILPAARPRARPGHLRRRADRARHRRSRHRPEPAPALARGARPLVDRAVAERNPARVLDLQGGVP